MKRFVFVSVLAPAVLGACAGGMQMNAPSAPVADAVKVPEGHRVAMQTSGKGEILYECREKKDAAGQFEWTFVGPDATLSDRSGSAVGKYYGPPATWLQGDGDTGGSVARRLRQHPAAIGQGKSRDGGRCDARGDVHSATGDARRHGADLAMQRGVEGGETNRQVSGRLHFLEGILTRPEAKGMFRKA